MIAARTNEGTDAMTDLILAVVHHLLVFSLVALIMVEAVLLRDGISGPDILRLARFDSGYGVVAGLIVVVGVLRVVFGAKGAEFYLHNPFFWAKMGAFLVVGLLSIGPTLQFIAWRRRLKAEPAFSPPPADIRRARGWIRLEGGFVVLVVVFAAMMARYGLF